MHTPRIQNMSIDELLTEAELTDNEVALRLHELSGEEYSEDDMEEARDEAFENGEAEGRAREHGEAQEIINSLLAVIYDLEESGAQLSSEQKSSVKDGEDY